MNIRENLPMMLSANDIQTMGFTRTMAYNILNREDVPVVKIGSRKFIQRDKFFDWLDSREKDEIVKENPIYVQKDKEKAYENHRSPSLCGYRKGYQSIQENY